MSDNKKERDKVMRKQDDNDEEKQLDMSDDRNETRASREDIQHAAKFAVAMNDGMLLDPILTMTSLATEDADGGAQLSHDLETQKLDAADVTHQKATNSSIEAKATLVVERMTDMIVTTEGIDTAESVGSTEQSEAIEVVNEVSSASVRQFIPRQPRQEVLPGAFAIPGPEAEDRRDNITESDTENDPELVEISAEVVDDEEENRKRNEQVEKEVEEHLERDRIEQEKSTAVAEIVHDKKCSPMMKRLATLGAVLIITVIVLSTVLPQVLEPTPKSPLPGLIDLLSSVSFDDEVALQTNSTPQNYALKWLEANVDLADYNDTRKIQHYVLATLYFSTTGDNWTEKVGWMSNNDE